MRRALPVFIAALLITGGWLRAQDTRSADSGRKIDAGRKIYDSEGCAKCHMVGGQGNRMFPLDNVGARLSAEEIRRWLTNTAQMEDALPRSPAIKMSTRKYDFSDADLDAIVAFLKSLQK
jgi:mono/diheme cytochrome c family protein